MTPDDFPDDISSEEQEPEELESEELESEEQDTPEEEKRPSLVINIYSWATPIIALVMLVLGLFLGYAGRPWISEKIPALGGPTTPTPVAQAPTVQQTAAQQPSAADTEELMKYLVGQTKHFRGDANAPVTLIEFSDFQ
jgi:hypothetical protein